MNSLRRHDLDAEPALSEAELRRRWRHFYLDVLTYSPHRIERLAAPFLSNGARRQRLLNLIRWFGRSIARDGARDGPFLKNYDFRQLDIGTDGKFTADVTTLEIDSTTGSAALDELARRVEQVTSPWIFFVDKSVNESDRQIAVSFLWHHSKGGEVTFADEKTADDVLPIFKCSTVGPHTLLSYNQVGRPALIPTAELRRIGGIRPEMGPAFEHDVYLRLQEAGVNFTHLDTVLPAGRTIGNFTDPLLSQATLRVASDAMARRHLPGMVRPTEVPSVISWHVQPAVWPTVNIVIPTRDRLELLKRCLESLMTVTTYPSFDVTILDNDSIEADTLEFLSRCQYKVVRCSGPFNYSSIINRGVSQTEAPYIVTMNNDIVVTTPNWLEEMVGVSLVRDVGIVGATQLNSQGEHDHDGITIAPYPQHLRSGVNYRLQDESLHARRDVAAVTGAVQLISRQVWDELDGMDESLAVVFNDVDLCLRAQLAGHYVVMVPDVVFQHDAGSTRGRLEPLADRNRFVRRWDIFGGFRDPFFPSSLQLVGSNYLYRPIKSPRLSLRS